MEQAHPIASYEAFAERIALYLTLNKTRRSLADTDEARAYRERMSEITLAAHRDHRRWIAARVARQVESTSPRRERLEAFWADHFTTYGKGGPMVAAPWPYVQSAIRPHLAGRFEDLPIAAVTHPMMLQTLDQPSSAGPEARAPATPDLHDPRDFVETALGRPAVDLEGGGAFDLDGRFALTGALAPLRPI